MSELPPGWEWTTFGEVGEWFGGATPSKSNSAFWVNGTIPWISPKDISSPNITKSTDRITENALANSPVRLIPPNSVVIVVRSGILERMVPTTIVPFATTLNQDLKALRPHAGISYKWIAYCIRAFEDNILKTCRKSGTTVASLDVSRLMQLKIPLAPTAEQWRVVAALEDHLSVLEAGLLTLRSAQQKVSVFTTAARESIFRMNSHQQNMQLVEILREPLRNGYSGRVTTNDSAVRVVTLTAVTKNQFIDKNTKLCDTGNRDVSGLWLEPGDILIQRSNTPDLVGTSALYCGEPNWAIFPDLLIRVRVDDRALPAFLDAALSTRRIREYFKSSAKGLAGSMPKIDQGTVESTTLHLPPLDIQREIIDQTQEIDRVTAKLASGLELADRRAVRLRESLLHSALSGFLVPQDPDEESASVLLERIGADRAAQPKPKRGRRVTKNIDQGSLL